MVGGLAVYPRGRGEHTTVKAGEQDVAGLSPLARGTRGADYDFPIIYRFIPAGAGNTIPARLSSGRTAVYPRWRGEHLMCRATFGNSSGLSPLARGTHE